MERSAALFNRRLPFRKTVGAVFLVLFLLAVLVGIAGLVTLLAKVLIEGLGWLNWNFLTSYPSRHPEEAGIKSAMMGTIWLMGLTAAFTVPMGVSAAIYLEEFAPRNWLTRVIEVNISNLAGVPSIVYGLLGLAVFVQWMALGRSLLAGGPHPLPARSAHRHPCLSRGHSRRPSDLPARRLRPRRHQVGGDQARCASRRLSGHPHRHHPGHVPRHRRGRTRHRHQRPRLSHLRPDRPPG